MVNQPLTTINARTYKLSGKKVMIHPPGFAAYNVNKKLAILHIPKNASSAIKHSTNNSSEWTAVRDFRKLEVDRLCVILRDPASRFLSAVNMYLGGRSILSNFIGINNAGKKFTSETNDPHFVEQVDFLVGTDHSKIDFFYYNTEIISDINDHYGLMLENENVNISEKIVTSVDQRIINQVYENDYTLIESVNFVNVKKEKNYD